MSNILKLFQQPPPEPESKEDCLQCLCTAAGVMTGGGLYLSSGLVFRNVAPSRATPPWYRQSVRIAGVAVAAFGLWRAHQAWNLWKYGPTNAHTMTPTTKPEASPGPTQ